MPTTATMFPTYSDAASATYTGNGSTTDFSIPFDYIGKSAWTGTKTSQVRVYVGDNWDTATENTSWTQPSASTVRVSPAPASGKKILVRRDSQLLTTRMDFQNGSRITGDQMDLVYQQTLYSAQEINDRLKDLAAKISSSGTIGNSYSFTGNGSTTSWALGTETGLTAASILVSVDGLFYETNQYSVADVSSVSTLTISPAPGAGKAVRVRVLCGGLLASPTPGSNTVGTTQLQDGSVTFAKTNFSATGSNGQALMKRSGAWTADGVLAADISNLAATVQAYRLDQFALPTANINANNHNVINVTDPTTAQMAATKNYVDTAISGITSSTVDGGRTVSGQFTCASSFSTVTLGWQFDLLLVWPDYGLTSGVRGISPTARYNDGTPADVGYEPIVQTAAHGGTLQVWQLQASGAQGQIKIQRLSTGFQHKLFSFDGTAGVGTQVFSYLAIRNSTVA